MIKSRFDQRIYFYLLIASAASFLISLFLLELFAGLLSILWLFEKYEDKKKAFDIFTALILVFGFVRILSIVFSQYPSVSMQSYYKDALFYLSFFAFSFYLKAINLSKLKILFNYAFAAAIVVSLIGIFLFNLKIIGRAESFTAGFSTFSSYLVTMLGLMIAFPLKGRLKNIWWLWPLAIAVVLSGVVTSLGRTNILIAALLLLAGLFFRKISFKNLLFIIFAAGIICGISFINNKWEVLYRVEAPGALSDRDVLFKAAKELAFQRPLLGFGPRTFHQIFPYHNLLQDKKVGSWHNDFIQVYFESGMLGLIGFLMLIFTAVFYSYKYLKKRKGKDDWYNIVLGNLIGIIALVLSSVTAGFIDSPVLSVLFGLMLSIFSAALYHSNRNAAG